MSVEYPEYLDRMIVEIADRQNDQEIEAINLQKVHEELFDDAPRSWLESLASELQRQGLGVDWQDTSNLSFRPNGQLFARAAELRRASSKRLPMPNWQKWGAVAAMLAIPTTIILWWLS